MDKDFSGAVRDTMVGRETEAVKTDWIEIEIKEETKKDIKEGFLRKK